MGISMYAVGIMEQYGILAPGLKLLDLGSSNLYGATTQQIVEFVQRHNPNPRNDLDVWAERLASGSGTNDGGMALNQSFAGELFEAIGMVYDSIDIADGYKTTYVDLNVQRLPEKMVGQYDSVINFGTSEHILNQMNTFAAVHAATKVGGQIMHNLPSVGFVDHGYFCYTSRFFFDMSGYNHYDVVDMWYDGPIPDQGENLFLGPSQYQTYFPSLTNRLEQIGVAERETMQNSMLVPTISISVVLRKTQNIAFMGMVETSTSVGELGSTLQESYS
ncbi:hypothetical protein [Rhodospirillum sp. A1_3_36]|uniref:hypothetical protein n=1 Tax=Rhodospirillum sp. A1_3_36 TaxID=3391666 RepID=UPI0039A60589